MHKEACVYKGHTSDKTTVPKSFKLDQALMNYAEKNNTHVKLHF